MLRIEERTGVHAARVRLLLLLVGQIGQILHAAAEPGTGIDQHVLVVGRLGCRRRLTVLWRFVTSTTNTGTTATVAL